jgi:hypothetical protein
MVCKPRKVRFDIRDTKTDEKIAPDKVMIGAQDVKENAEVKPGDNSLEIHKSGYQSMIENLFTLPVGEDPYTLVRKMVSAKVELKFILTDARTKETITADRILLDEKATADGSYCQPGNYDLKILKQAYKTLREKIQVPLQDRFVVERELSPSSILIEWKITGDYPGDEIVPSTILLDNKPVEEGSHVAPGPHTLVIKDPAYQTLTEEIVIPDGIPKYVIEKTLISLPRPVDLTVQYDILPGQALPPYRFSLKKLDTEEILILKGGEKVKPSTYEVTVSQSAYNNFTMSKRIFPGVKPEKIEAKLEAKNRMIQADIAFYVDPTKDTKPHVPPKDLGHCLITFMEIETQIRRAITSGRSIKPGKYDYVVELPGYKMVGGSKKIYLEPSEDPYAMQERMEAEPRQISLAIEYKGTTVTPTDVRINDEKFTFTTRYRPGRYRLYAKFAEYQDIQQDFEIPPGVAPYTVVGLELKRK